MNGPLLRERRQVAVQGVVQGVGFRPFVYALAQRHTLAGLVRNDAAGVYIEAEGSPDNLDAFLRDLQIEHPPLAHIETVAWRATDVRGDRAFAIEVSRGDTRRGALVSPDVCTCADCLTELFDPANRRYRYPFINCTNCGPRFTISCAVPYDRATTTMAGFAMCAECRREYDDPSDRRFHAQPNACPDCGPRVRLLGPRGAEPDSEPDDPILHTAELLRAGAIIAIKGLGGYHLACDPFNHDAVEALRRRKVRQDKPFALMARDLQQVHALCHVAPEEGMLLSGKERPIVLLERRDDCAVADGVAPRQLTIGVMLAYTPLHAILLRDTGIPLVMTSGNRCDEPIAYRDGEALDRLGSIADYFLVHDRPIHMRCDDSVVRAVAGHTYPIRRSRGYAPVPLAVPWPVEQQILACGAELKNTFCLARQQHLFLSHHIGDLENYETLHSFKEGIEHYCRLFDVAPQLVAYDLHPEYLSTKHAHELEETGLPAIGIQHHHAHIASCLVDNGRMPEERTIGAAFDGTGYGLDGALWGGEFLEGSIDEGFTRRGHLEYMPLPGGAAAIRQPWRMAVAYLLQLFGEDEVSRLPLAVIQRAGERHVRLVRRLLDVDQEILWMAPRTSSAGRLFDAVAALLDLPGTTQTTYEGQAAVELELTAAGPTKRGYPLSLVEGDKTWIMETQPIVREVVADLLAGVPRDEIAARFHRAVAEIVLLGCRRIRAAGGPSMVALSGGTFQNMLLLRQAAELLAEDGFDVLIHRRIPANDAGISIGQAVLANTAYRQPVG